MTHCNNTHGRRAVKITKMHKKEKNWEQIV